MTRLTNVVGSRNVLKYVYYYCIGNCDSTGLNSFGLEIYLLIVAAATGEI